MLLLNTQYSLKLCMCLTVPQYRGLYVHIPHLWNSRLSRISKFGSCDPTPTISPSAFYGPGGSVCPGYPLPSVSSCGPGTSGSPVEPSISGSLDSPLWAGTIKPYSPIIPCRSQPAAHFVQKSTMCTQKNYIFRTEMAFRLYTTPIIIVEESA